MSDQLILIPEHVKQIQLVFEFYRKVLNHPRACLDMDRNFLISRAIGWGYDLESLCLACYGCSVSDFHQGRSSGKWAGKRSTRVMDIFETADKIDSLVEVAEQHIQSESLKEQRRQTQSDVKHVGETMTKEEWARIMAEMKAGIGAGT